MWSRRTLHECASELESVSKQFRNAYMNSHKIDSNRRDEMMREYSNRGVELLRILALAIRSEQDAGRLMKLPARVGSFKDNVAHDEIALFPQYYRPPYKKVRSSKSLKLRDGLNKIAHADPGRSSFYADDTTHDLILCGKNQGKYWIAILSILDLCLVIKCMPDCEINKSDG